MQPLALLVCATKYISCAGTALQIVVGRAHTVDSQMDLLMTVGAKMVEEPYKLLIVDSIMALFR